MALQETGKQRAVRIPLDYFKKPDALGRWKNRLAWLALGVALLYVAGGWVLGSPARQRDWPRGPVSYVHQAWENNCEVCHKPFEPIQQDNVWLLTPWAEKPLAADQNCAQCHAGPEHNDIMREEDVVSCGTCHRDHRGRQASLVSLPDPACTHCHADLKTSSHTKSAFHDRITVFSLAGHPPFKYERGKQADPGKIKFNHEVHLTPGMGSRWTLDRIMDDKERARYRGGPDGLVQLDCASCHQLDSRDSRSPVSSLPARSAGEYMLPVSYDTNCKACHPLTFDPGVPLAIPHHLQPAEVNSFLWRAFVEQKAIKDPDLPRRLTRPLPGKPFSPEEKQLRTEIGIKVANAEKYIYTGKTTCGECHSYQLGAGHRLEILKPQTAAIWLKHARFDHSAHRALNCADCHAPDLSTRGGDGKPEGKNRLLPNIDNCVQCHAPAHTVGGKPQGGVRFNCTECHRYHHGTQPLQGIGARARDARRKRTIESFLSGKNE